MREVACALVSGTRKLKPLGTEVIASFEPREKAPEELVPRRVSTKFVRLDPSIVAGAASMLTSSSQPEKAVVALPPALR